MSTVTGGWAATRWASADDLLGPAERRFFGSGYRRIGQQLRDLTFDEAAGGRSLHGVAAVTYPADWSRKRDDVILRPHLSTVDALIFGARLAEHVVSHSQGLSAGQRSGMWLRRVEIKAGPKPDETGLDSLPASARLLDTVEAGVAAPGRLVSAVDCRVGGMTLRLDVDHELGRAVGDTATNTPMSAIGVYYDGYRGREHSITAVELDADALEVRADVLVGAAASASASSTPRSTSLDRAGSESAYAPAVSLIDAFVVALQLGQILLYRLDGIERGTSNTLWMRRTVICADSPHRPANRSYPVTARLADPLVIQARGGTWRTGEIDCALAGVSVRCAVTHQLPAATA